MTDMKEDRRAAILIRIRGLLAQAGDLKGTTEAERDAFRAKADELMTKYAVEEFEAMQAGRIIHKPESRRVNIDWYFHWDNDVDARTWTFSLFYAVYDHARCVVVRSQVTHLGIMCAGFKGDLDYADMLFTSLMLQLMAAIDPKPDPAFSYHENLERMRAAGFNWNEAWERMMLAPSLLPDYIFRLPSDRQQRDRMTRDYRSWCRRTGREQNYANHATFRRNFALGYASRVGQRLREMRSAQNEGNSGKFEIVLRDVRKTVEDFVHDTYAETRPHAEDCKCANCRRKRVPALKTKRFDHAAYGQGVDAGNDAVIQGSPERNVGGNRDQLEG